MVLATGVLKAIARAQPKLTIDVLASAANRAVLAGNPYVGAVITLDKKRPWTYVRLLWRIRRAAYDAVVDSMVLSPSLTATLLMWLSGARHRIGIAGRGNHGVLTWSVPPLTNATHYIDRSAALLAAFGEPPHRPGAWQPELFLSPGEQREGEAHWSSADDLASSRQSGQGRRLVVNVSATSRAKYWPVERFVVTLRAVRGAFPDLAILIIGLPKDLPRMAEVGRGANVRVAYTPHYRQMMAIVAASDVVFTADTAVTHIASAFGKATLVMFVGDGGDWYGPYGTSGRVIASPGPTLESLEAEPVTRALTELLEPGAVEPDRSGERIASGSERNPPVARAPQTVRHHAGRA